MCVCVCVCVCVCASNLLLILCVREKSFAERFCCVGLNLKIPHRRGFYNCWPNDYIL